MNKAYLLENFIFTHHSKIKKSGVYFQYSSNNYWYATIE